MKRDGEPVEVANVQWPKVVVEGVVQQGVIDGEVHGLQARRVGDTVLLPLRGAATACPGLVWSVELVGVGDGGGRERRRRGRGRSIASPV